MHIPNDEIHIWTSSLALSSQKEHQYQSLLNPDEQVRASQFYFPKHRTRFIAARVILRKILSLYTYTKSEKIKFNYGVYGKPFLAFPINTNLQFNLAHSDNLAIYAVTRNYLVGIDVEKIQADEKPDVAKRFFSLEENTALLAVPKYERAKAFYRIWSRKEAIIKATGKGLTLPLSSFTVSHLNITESIAVDNQMWHLLPLTINLDFNAALAISQPIECLTYYDFID